MSIWTVYHRGRSDFLVEVMIFDSWAKKMNRGRFTSTTAYLKGEGALASIQEWPLSFCRSFFIVCCKQLERQAAAYRRLSKGIFRIIFRFHICLIDHKLLQLRLS